MTEALSEGLLVRRVDTLEEIMKELGYQSLRTQKELARLSKEMREFKVEMHAFKDEMREFKDEMREFKDEMREFKDEMLEFKDEMLEFKDEMLEFKDEMRAFKTESERDRKEMNRQWGDLANRMGTLLEDIVAPNLPRVARQLLGCPTPDFFAIRVKRRFGGETREYDALVVCPNLVLINETKSKFQSAHVEHILETIEEFPRLYPEYADRRPIGTLATLYPDDSLVRLATRRGVLVMGMGDETMDVLNPQALGADG